MSKSMVTGVGIGIAVALAGGAFASYRIINAEPKFAEVVEAKPVTKKIRVAREECHDETVTRVREPKDEKRIAGTAIGAVVGGLVGNQIGDGKGQTIATVAGAAAGGYAGNRIQKRMQQGNTYESVERRCATVYDSHEKVLGYDVKYKLGEQVTTVRMDHMPGATLPVENGKVVLTKPAPKKDAA